MGFITGVGVTYQDTGIVGMTLTHGRIKATLTMLIDEINNIKVDYTVKIDLLVVHQNARKVWSKMDNEMIECRKRGRFTANYQTLFDEIQSMIKIIEKEVFWQKLH